MMGTEYYLDLDYLSEFCAIKFEEPETESDNEDDEEKVKISPLANGIDVFKYEIIKMCLDRLLFEREGNPMESELMSIRKSGEDEASYKLAFNTLLAHKIIKEYE